ncbi:hypothetical protein LJR129_004915 [Acidovorax sp. LjRoot129]|uniref:DUF6036 family nucleotidyltransferase n=1 Tax=unclassified Acidovorax TaxID=2684926 RepID=UPI003ECF2566
MNRDELEHLIRASGAITNEYEFVIIGSQSILGQIPYPEPEFKMSAEADIYPRYAPELADKIDGGIGEGSDFHHTYGFYAQGVGPETAFLPDGWETRLWRVQNGNTDSRIGWCLDVTDLFMSKAAAARDKDQDYCLALLRNGYVSLEAALELAPGMPLEPEELERLIARIKRWAKLV